MHLFTKASRRKFNHWRVGLLLGSLLFATGVVGARADAVEGLQGAWVMEFSECSGVFEKVREKIRFKDRNYANDSGFIISGTKVMGPIAGCTISQVDEQSGRFSALLSCSDALVSRKFSWSFRILDTTHFERLDPKFPDLPTKYKKCVF